MKKREDGWLSLRANPRLFQREGLLEKREAWSRLLRDLCGHIRGNWRRCGDEGLSRKGHQSNREGGKLCEE